MTKVDEVKSTIKFQMKKVGPLLPSSCFKGPTIIPSVLDLAFFFFCPVIGALSGCGCWTCEDDRR